MAIYSTRSGTASQISPEENARINAQQIRMRQEEARSNANHRRLVGIGKFASVAIPTAGAGLAAAGVGAAASPAFGIGAANTGAWGGVGMTPAAFSGVGAAAPVVSQTASKAIPWMRIGELGAGLFSNWRGNAAQSKANDQEFAYRSQADERAFQMQSQMETQRQKEWAAQQQMLQQQFAAQQEQERLDRLEAEAERNRQWGLSDRTEAARVPYRQAGQVALRDLLAGLR